MNSYVQNFLNNEPIPSIDFTYQTMKQVVPLLPLEMANEVIKELVLPTDTNLVVLNFNNEKEGAVYPTEEGLKKAVDAGRTAKIEAYVDNVKDEPLMTRPLWLYRADAVEWCEGGAEADRPEERPGTAGGLWLWWFRSV